MTSALWILVALLASAAVLQNAGSLAHTIVAPEGQTERDEAIALSEDGSVSPELYSKDDVDVLVRYNLQCEQFTVDINLFNHFEDVLITVADEDARVLCEGSMQPKYFQRTSCEFPVPTTLKDGGNYLDVAIRRADDAVLVYRERHYFFHLVNQVIAVRAGRLSLGGRLRQLALALQEQAQLVTALSLLGVAVGPLRVALMRYKRSVEAAVAIVPPSDAPAPPAPPSEGPRWSPRAFFAPRAPPQSTVACQPPPQIALSRQPHPLLYGEQVLSLLLTWVLRQPQRLLGNVRDQLRLPAPLATSSVPSLPAPAPAPQRGSIDVTVELVGAKPFWWSATAADAAPAVAVTARAVESPVTSVAAPEPVAAPQKAPLFAWPSFATESSTTDARDAASATNTAATSWPSPTAQSPRSAAAPAAPAAPTASVPSSSASPTPPDDDHSFTVLRLATLPPVRRLAETLHQILVPPPAAPVAPPAAAAPASGRRSVASDAKAAATAKAPHRRRSFLFRRSPSADAAAVDAAAAAAAAVAPVAAVPGPVDRQSKTPASPSLRWLRWRRVLRNVVVAAVVVVIASQRPHALLASRASSSLAATRDWWTRHVAEPVRERLARPRAAAHAASPPLVASLATPPRPLTRRARRLRSSWALLPSTLAVGPQALPLSVTDTRLFREVDRCLLERRPPCASLVAVTARGGHGHGHGHGPATDAVQRRSASRGDVATRRRRRSSSVSSAAAASRWWLVMGQCLVALWPVAWRPAKQPAQTPRGPVVRDVAASAIAADEATERPDDVVAVRSTGGVSTARGE
eukprot:gene12126-8671_t